MKKNPKLGYESSKKPPTTKPPRTKKILQSSEQLVNEVQVESDEETKQHEPWNPCEPEENTLNE